MDVYRLGLKLFVADPNASPAREFVPIFHTWIQKQIVPGHVLIDVHDYSHIHEGPGILLVGHEGNFSLDLADGRPGLLYYRKHPSTNGNSLKSVIRTAFQACALIEDEPSLRGRLRFRTDELAFVANDRLQVPNNDQMLSEMRPELSAAFQELLKGTPLKIQRVSADPKERLTIRIQTGQTEGVKGLLARIV